MGEELEEINFMSFIKDFIIYFGSKRVNLEMLFMASMKQIGVDYAKEG